MRAFDWDLIRGGHYGQRSCEPHLKAEHMAAPTNAAYAKKALANSEPSTHDPKRTSPGAFRYIPPPLRCLIVEPECSQGRDPNLNVARDAIRDLRENAYAGNF